MSGKSYTMKEMKDIVEYLTEHKAYSDIKGRKMWMDLASSDISSRTWQSLKETFLKRILPDIQNPYYKLSVHQLASFKQGCDIEAKLNNKLEIQSSDAVSNTEDENNKVIDQADNGVENNEDVDEEVPSGENLQQLDSNVRDSTDTLVLDNCLQTAEDIEKDIQSANEDDDKQEDSQPKSLRDLITYSEPLSVLQHTIDDFATDEEGSNGEPQMQIVEPEEIAKKNGTNGNCVIEIPDSDSGEKETKNQSSAKQDTDKADLLKPNNEKSVDTITDIVEVETENNESTALFPENHVGNKTNEAETTSKPCNKTDNQRKSSETTQNTNTITDSLPNNQEAFQNKAKLSSKSVTNEEKKKSRKRANSQEISKPKDIKKRNLSLKKQSISDSDTIALNKDKKELNPKIIEQKLCKIDEAKKPVNGEMKLVNEVSKPVPINSSEEVVQPDVEMPSSDMENLCLQSVSVYEEEQSDYKIIESQKDKNEKPKEKPTNTKKNDDNEIVILKSHSDSATDSSKLQSPPKKGKKETTKQRRDRALADVFGFSRGGVNKKRKRTVSYKQSSSHQVHQISSGSSEWTSDTDTEFISPPRGRKNRQMRKYLKPRHARILSLEEEGGLFVMYGKKIYPIVKDGKIIKNYVTYTPEEEVEHEESFWKLKYVEEKKRTKELKKLLNEVTEKAEGDGTQELALAVDEKTISNIKQKEVIRAKRGVPDNKSTVAVPSKTDTEDKTVKFKFTKNNEELQLEGHWTHVNPVLAQVMQLLQKDEKKDTIDQTKTSSTQENKKKTKISNEQKNTKQNVPNVNGTKSNVQVPVSQESGKSTPIIPIDIEDEVKERVSKIESEIFKEIEENEKEESTKQKASEPEEHITKRKGRPRKSSTTTSSTSASASPSKKIKLDAEIHKDKEVTEKNEKIASEPRITRSPKKSLDEIPKKAKKERTRESLSRKSKEVSSPNLNGKGKEEVRYKIPSPPKTKKSKIAKASKPKANRYLTSLDCKAHSSPESRSMCSIDSTQDFQDSDESVPKMTLRRKKRTSTVLYKRKSVNHRTNARLFLTDEFTSESSNSYQSSPIKSMTFQNSTIGSDNYSSESYRLLMNKNWSQKHKIQNLEKIDESPNLNELKSISEQIYEDIMGNDVEMQTDSKIKDGAFKIAHTDEDSISNVSLPTSPVLSIVQNMSVSKDLLSSVDDFPVENLPYGNQIILNNFIKSEPDVSMPLMARDCNIETNGHNGGEYHYNLSVVKDTPVSETFLNKVNKITIKDPTLTDSIDTKLKGLMLESTKKTMTGVCRSDENNNMEIAENKTKSRKRSSTPLKRKSSRRLTLSNNEPCIEEHTESCSYSRKSCPPVVQHFENIAIDANLNQNISKPKTRQKKDVIKVKITKPKQKADKERQADKISEKAGSHVIDGVNESESGVFLNFFNDSVDLIHNHSETCLNAHDCMGDSVELLEGSKSVVFLDSTGNSEHLLHKKHNDNVNSIEYELFSNDAQDGSELGKVKSANSTVFHSVMGSLSQQNSLITEDLSDGSPVKNIEDGGNKIARNTKWYLLSEDETSNTNFLDINQNATKGLGCGANLNQLFPITCAVPELSTITEVSNQNEENLK